MNTDQIKELTDSIKKLPTKDDLNVLCDKLKDIFFHELSLRDLKITELEDKIITIQEQNKRTAEQNKKQIEDLTARVNSLNEKLNDQKINNERNEVNQVESTVKNNFNLVVIGDSIVKYVNVDKINPNGRNKLICIPGGTLHDIRNALISESKQSTIESVILNVGTNHIPYESPIEISRQLSSFCNEIRVKLPNTRLLFSGILPKVNDKYTSAISYINNRLYHTSRQIGFKLIMHKKFFLEDGTVNFNLLAKDRVHLSKHGVAVYGATLKYFFHH